MNFNNDMLYLSLCALKNTKPDIQRVNKIDFDNLFKICKIHKLSALVCYALEMVITPEQRWLEAKGKSIRKNMLLDLERSRILSFMEDKGIKYMPLKGVFIKDYYPKPGMRQMADNDIYFDGTYRAELEKFMRSIGYDTVNHSSRDDEYIRPPVYNFEMHYALFGVENTKNFAEYYSDMDKFLLKDKENKFGYHFSPEDFYIYVIAHQYKHFIYGGIGVSSFLDCGVLLNKFSASYDWDYIKTETDKLGIADFEQKQRKLWEKLFINPDTNDLTDEEITMLEYFISSGAYGTLDGRIKSLISKGTEKATLKMKAHYVFSRLFPPVEFYKRYYPFFYSHKYLIPFCFIYRIFKAIFDKNSKSKIELKVLKED